MLARFTTPTHEQLLAEQKVVQAEKFQGRLLDEYNSTMFPGQEWPNDAHHTVAEFIRPLTKDTGHHVTLQGLLYGIAGDIPDRPIHWADMGGGKGMAMRQLGATATFDTGIEMTKVDLFDYDIDNFTPEGIEYFESRATGITTPEVALKLLLADVETVTLPKPADLITAVEVMQYLNNPLAAIANWYNQLANNGVMILASDHDWSTWIRFKNRRDETPTYGLLKSFETAEVRFSCELQSDQHLFMRQTESYDRFRILAVRKTPNTTLAINKCVESVWVNPQNYKATYYQETDSGTPIATII